MLVALPFLNQGLRLFRDSLYGNLPYAELKIQHVPSSKQQELLLPELLHSCLATAPGKICSSRIDQGSAYEMSLPSGSWHSEKGAKTNWANLIYIGQSHTQEDLIFTPNNKKRPSTINQSLFLESCCVVSIVCCDKQSPVYINATSGRHAGPSEQGSPYWRGAWEEQLAQ